MTNDIIQKAREVLAKWREGTTPGSWQRYDAVNDWSNEPREVIKSGPILIAPDMLPGNARLIVGTAGNPDLLDAIDGLLWRGTFNDGSSSTHYAERIAAAILAADERVEN